jgi:hypothetical protein
VSDPEDRLLEEIAVLAYHFHWPLSELLDMEHPVRLRFLDELARIRHADAVGH